MTSDHTEYKLNILQNNEFTSIPIINPSTKHRDKFTCAYKKYRESDQFGNAICHHCRSE